MLGEHSLRYGCRVQRRAVGQRISPFDSVGSILRRSLQQTHLRVPGFFGSYGNYGARQTKESAMPAARSIGGKNVPLVLTPIARTQ